MNYGDCQDELQIYRILIALLCFMALFMEPAYPRNEYLNDGSARCGEVDVSVSNRDYDYDNYDNSWNESNSQEVRLTFRTVSYTHLTLPTIYSV